MKEYIDDHAAELDKAESENMDHDHRMERKMSTTLELGGKLGSFKMIKLENPLNKLTGDVRNIQKNETEMQSEQIKL